MDKPTLRVIGVAGQKQQGKDQLSDYLAPKLTRRIPVPCHGGNTFEDAPWGRGSFASAVKRIFCDTFQKDLAFVEAWKTKDEVPPGMAMPVRQALTFIGDGFRKIQPDIWIETAFRPENDPYSKIISDVRYVNEARKIRSEGGMNILLYRPGFVNWDLNGSEREILPYVMWCAATGREGRIADFSEFQEQETWFDHKPDFNSGAFDPVKTFWNSLPDEMIEISDRGVKQEFFDNLSQFDLFIRCESGVQFIHAKVDELIIPYIHANYSAA